MNDLAVLVVVDANFMTIPAQFNIDMFLEAERILERQPEFILLSSVLDEIEALGEGKGLTNRRIFGIARRLAERCTVIESPFPELPVDLQLLMYATSIKGILATNDRELRASARKQGIPVLYLRAKKHLSLEGLIE
ncbi:MAG: nucleotide-binding protein [Candidatus Thorarchaeota archaeon]|nr:nucleotide-binding protein [Candidatus Thorarchaeota archaeon]